MTSNYDTGLLHRWLDRIGAANRDFAVRYPGDSGHRQPVHTVYGGAQIFSRNTAPRLGELALRSLQEYAPDAGAFAAAIGLREDLADEVYARVRAKLELEPVEDFRIDFEDGYGNRSDEEEDAAAEEAAREMAAAIDEGTLSPFIGIRIKPLSEELKARSLRTLDRFLATWADAGAGELPDNFVVTLPKIQHRTQVEVLVDALEALELKFGFERQTSFEVMVETPQSIFDIEGRLALPNLVDAGQGRCVAAHFGTYDYTALMGITAAHQHMTHPACDFARHVQQVSLAGTGIWISDGATNVLPVRKHRPAKEGPPLTEEQVAENRQAVHDAWRLHFDHVTHSLVHAYYQGWDLHPAQLPTRYAAVYAFFLESMDAAGQRLRNFVDQAAQATLVGDVFDDAATGQGLLNFFLRAINCGAISEEEAEERTGLTVEELRSRSFVKILAARRHA